VTSHLWSVRCASGKDDSDRYQIRSESAGPMRSAVLGLGVLRGTVRNFTNSNSDESERRSELQPFGLAPRTRFQARVLGQVRQLDLLTPSTSAGAISGLPSSVNDSPGRCVRLTTTAITGCAKAGRFAQICPSPSSLCPSRCPCRSEHLGFLALEPASASTPGEAGECMEILLVFLSGVGTGPPVRLRSPTWHSYLSYLFLNRSECAPLRGGASVLTS